MRCESKVTPTTSERQSSMALVDAMSTRPARIRSSTRMRTSTPPGCDTDVRWRSLACGERMRFARHGTVLNDPLAFLLTFGRRTYALIVISNCSTQNTAPNGEREGAIRRQLNGSPACAAVTQRYDWMQPVRDAESRRWEKRTLAQVGC